MYIHTYSSIYAHEYTYTYMYIYAKYMYIQMYIYTGKEGGNLTPFLKPGYSDSFIRYL
jgi:hypothetical protein